MSKKLSFVFKEFIFCVDGEYKGDLKELVKVFIEDVKKREREKKKFYVKKKKGDSKKKVFGMLE